MFIYYHDIELVIHDSEELLCYHSGYAYKSGAFVMHCPLSDEIKLFYHDLLNAGQAAPNLASVSRHAVHLL